MVKTNSVKAWILASRPKTLSAAAVPVMLGISAAIMHVGSLHILWFPAMLCLLFAWVMQIDSNLVNDYFDFKHGNDGEHRLGPKRACTQGWVTPQAMKIAIAITTVLGCAIGLPLIIFGGWTMIIVGILCVAGCYLYTVKLSYLGMGDIMVLLFFGVVPVCCTYYLVLPPETRTSIGIDVIALSITCGMVVDTLLIVNNYRDYQNDRVTGKQTIVVVFGRKFAEYLYFALGNLAILTVMAGIGYDSTQTVSPDGIAYQGGHWQGAALGFIYLAFHNHTFWKMKKIHQGKKLNKVLGMTARNIFIFGIVSTIMLIGSILL